MKIKPKPMSLIPPIDAGLLKKWAKTNAPPCSKFYSTCPGCLIHRLFSDVIRYCEEMQELERNLKKNFSDKI